MWSQQNIAASSLPPCNGTTSDNSFSTPDLPPGLSFEHLMVPEKYTSTNITSDTQTKRTSEEPGTLEYFLKLLKFPDTSPLEPVQIGKLQTAESPSVDCVLATERLGALSPLSPSFGRLKEQMAPVKLSGTFSLSARYIAAMNMIEKGTIIQLLGPREHAGRIGRLLRCQEGNICFYDCVCHYTLLIPMEKAAAKIYGF